MSAAFKGTAQERIERDCIPEPMSGCWLWLKSCNAKGYAHLRWRNVMMRANRFAWQAYRGPIPDGLFVLHQCDNRLCVNPDHLFLGSHQDNMDDRDQKGRGAFFIGEAHPRAKLTDDDVKHIRNSHQPGTELAAAFNVSTALISHIKTKRIWKHI